MSNSPTLLDTHVLLWSLLKPEELHEAIKQHIATAQNDGQLFISSISLWEIAMLKTKKRINVYEPIREFLATIANIKGLVVKDLSVEIAAESVLLLDDFPGSPVDRIIVATTKAIGATLITRDEKILRWAELGHIKSLSA